MHPDAISDDDEFKTELGRLVRAAGSARDVAARTGLTKTTVNNLARALRTPRRSTLRMVADALDGENAEAWLRALDRIAPRPCAAPDLEAAALPRPTRAFRGRAADIAEVRRMLLRPASSSVPTTMVIDGMPGVGKTALAVQVARQAAGRFPGGVHFLDLGGYTDSVPELTPGQAVDELLRKLTQQVPDAGRSLDQHVADYRRRLAATPTLVVLDNARSADRVDLLQGGPGPSRVLVTSRRPLTSLEDAVSLTLGALPEEEAAAVLRAVIPPERLQGQDAAVAGIARLCGGLPLALRIAAAKLIRRPAWTVAQLAERLATEHRLLPELDDGDRSVAAAFRLSYEDLSPAQRRLFRLLGVLPGIDVEPEKAAALLGSGPDLAEELLEELLDVHLLVQLTAGRYRMHDLLRSYAAYEARADPADAPAVDAAVERALDWTLAAAARNRELLLARKPDEAGSDPGRQSQRVARDWFAAERDNLVATVAVAHRAHRHRYVCDLAEAIHRPLVVGGHYGDLASVAALRLGAARALRDPAAEAYALLAVADIDWKMDRNEESLGACRSALTLFQGLRDRPGQGDALNKMGNVFWRRNDYPRALTHYEQALALKRDAGDPAGEATMLSNIGAVRCMLGDQTGALDAYRAALGIRRRIGDTVGTAETLNNIGLAHERRDENEQALVVLREALALGTAVGGPSALSAVLTNLGNVCRRLGRFEEGDRHLRRAVRLARQAGEVISQAEALNCAGDLGRAAGRDDAALADYAAALELCSGGVDRYEEAHARDGMADILSARGDVRAALGQWHLAAELYAALGVPEAATVRHKMDAYAGVSRGR